MVSGGATWETPPFLLVLRDAAIIGAVFWKFQPKLWKTLGNQPARCLVFCSKKNRDSSFYFKVSVNVYYLVDLFVHQSVHYLIYVLLLLNLVPNIWR